MRPTADADPPGGAMPGASCRTRRYRRLFLVLFVAATLTVAGLALLPRLGHAVGQITNLPAPAWPWIVLAAAAIAVSYWFSGLALQAAVGDRLPMRRTVLVQLAVVVANRLTPGSVGGAVINVRYLTKLGYRLGRAGTAVTACGLAHAAVALLTVFVFGSSVIGHDASYLFGSLRGAWPWWFVGLLVVGFVLAAAVTTTLRASGAKLARTWQRLRIVLDDAVCAARALAAAPARMSRLLGWVAAVKAANLLALYAALWAFDGDVASWRVAVAYLVGATSAEAIPTPGGLGTVDAALLLGLVGAGQSAGAALAGVVVYRLLAFWAPIVPGMVSSAFLRRHAVL